MSTSSVRWPAERAREWIAMRGWRVGCNFVPSTAGNPLEMWQAETFDRETIERELGFAADLGFTSLRVFLHDLLWTQDRAGFLARLDEFLALANGHGIGTLFVLFDGVWSPCPRPGPQPAPRPGVHNSVWMQSPGAEVLADPERVAALRTYVQGVIDAFRDDARVDGWDLFNEPDNPNYAYRDEEIPDKDARVLDLLERSFAWAREVAPEQPLTAGLWRGDWSDPAGLCPIERLCVEASDVISLHHYGPLAELQQRVAALRRYERPLLCTEWMARSLGSTFDPHLVWMAAEGVGAYNWGLVAGRTQTHLSWATWREPATEEPPLWFHDILRADGTPYDEAEVALIRSVTRATR